MLIVGEDGCCRTEEPELTQEGALRERGREGGGVGGSQPEGQLVSLSVCLSVSYFGGLETVPDSLWDIS